MIKTKKELLKELKEYKNRCEKLNRIIYEIEHTTFTVTVDDVCSIVEADTKDGINAPEIHIKEMRTISDGGNIGKSKRVKFIIKHPNTYYQGVVTW